MPHDGSGFPDPRDILSYAEKDIHPCLSHCRRSDGEGKEKNYPPQGWVCGVIFKENARGKLE